MIHNDFQYYIISKYSNQSQSIELSNIIFQNWRNVWSQVFNDGGRTFTPNVDDYMRQDFIVSLFYKSQLVGFHFYSLFNIHKKMSELHSYFSGVNPESFQRLRDQNMTQIMSMEYLTVMPEFRKGTLSVPWAEVIISLGQKFLDTVGGDLCFGTARKDIRVDNMGLKLGFESLQLPISKYSYPCEVMICTSNSIREHPDKSTAEIINQIWENRIDSRDNKILPNQQVA